MHSRHRQVRPRVGSGRVNKFSGSGRVGSGPVSDTVQLLIAIRTVGTVRSVHGSGQVGSTNSVGRVGSGPVSDTV